MAKTNATAKKPAAKARKTAAAPASATAAKPAKTAAKPQKAKRTQQAEAVGPKTDAFGCRLGSQAAQINALVTSKPKTVAEVTEATGLAASRVRSHLKFLVNKKFAVETAEGFKLKPAAKAKPAG